MSLVCPECKSPALEIMDSVECGPTGIADENTIQRAHCGDCGALFFCVYQETRSFHSDRDDRTNHLAFLTDEGLWNSGAKIFEKSSSRISSEDKIAAAMSLLSKAQETGVSGKHIAYAPAPPQPTPPPTTPPQATTPSPPRASIADQVRSFFSRLLK